jgi:two-component system NarL family response regulator
MTVDARVRVLIADDHARTRGDVRDVLEHDGRFEVCADVPDAAAAIDAALREQPDVCVLDVHMPGSGVAVVRELGARLPGTKTVMLTVSAEDADMLAALRAGASGYLLKDMDLDDLPQALVDVTEGRAAVPGTLLARVLEELRDRSPRRRATAAAPEGAEQLTSREWQVLDLLKLDLGTAEIARRLHLSQATVRSHVARIVHKLGVPDRESVVRLFRRDR